MSIIWNEAKRTLTLHTNGSTYQMMVDSYNVLLHLYYGRATAGEMDYLLTYADRGFSGNLNDAGHDRTYSLDFLPQEYSVQGNGDFRTTALIVRRADGAYGCDLRYESHEILPGKYSLAGLPAVYAREDEAETLIVHMKDRFSEIRVDLLYGVLPELDVITRCVKIRNEEDGRISLERVHSAALDFVSGDFDLMTFYGRHCMERNVQRNPLGHGMQTIGSRRGTSSHQYNPMLILADHTATEEHGSCYAMSYLYSSSFEAGAEKDQFNNIRMYMGLQEECFSYPLEPGESFTAPEVILSYSSKGITKLSQNLQHCIGRHVCRGKYRDGGRPILLNSWEASYFDFDGDSICALAQQAADLGIDMLVMDDGWFGHRDDDLGGLGDWYVNEDKLGCTLGELIARINDMGLKFGIWFEPEGINENSALFRAHPDWAFRIPGRDPIHSRDQLLLDFSRKEVVDAIFEMVCKVLDQGKVDYVKWDLNRSFTDVFSAGTKDQGRVMYDYALGLYDFLDRLTARYPDMLLEGCSGGGGRFDAGMLYYSPQIWCSDNTDALDRQIIQYGTSFGYPISAMGSHVSTVPNHQTGRSTPLETRGITAMSGTFGYELNPALMTPEEKDTVRQQIADYRRFENLIVLGDYYRITDPAHDSVAAWCIADERGEEALLCAVVREIHGNMPINYVRARGLVSGALYREEKSERIYPADALMEIGIPLEFRTGDYNAHQFHLIRVQE